MVVKTDQRSQAVISAGEFSYNLFPSFCMSCVFFGIYLYCGQMPFIGLVFCRLYIPVWSTINGLSHGLFEFFQVCRLLREI